MSRRPASLLRPLLLASMLVHAAFVGSRVTVALDAIALRASPFEVGLLMALYGLLPMLFSVAVGRMIDRVGVQRPMFVSSGLLALSIALPFAWPGMGALYASSALNGLIFVVFMIAIQNTAGTLGEPSERMANFNLLALSFATSGFVGPMLAGFAIDSIGHRASFLILACLALAAALLLGLNRRALPDPHPQHRRAGRAGIGELLREPRLQRVFIASGLLSVAWDAFTFAIPLYGSGIGLSASVIGVVLGAFAAATFAIRIVLPLLTRRYKPWPLIIVSMLSAGACYFLFPWIDSVPLLITLAFALGLGLGMSQPMVLSLIHGAAPEGHEGEAVGVRATLVSFSQTAIPVLFGALGATLGMTPVFLSMSACLVVGGWVVKRRGVRSN